MRILFLNHNVVRRGGTYFRAFQAGRHLAARGHHVTLLSIAAERRWGFEREIDQGVEIVHTPDWLWGRGRTGWDPWDTLNRLGYLRGQMWDAIHAWDSRPAVVFPALYARRQSRPAGGKLIMDWCDWWGRGGTQVERNDGLPKSLIGPVETHFEEAYRTRADGTTVISRALYERARGLGVPASRLWLLPNGCEVDEPPLAARAQARARLGLPATEPVAISVGALTRPDAVLLFDTLRRLFARRAGCRFVLIGNPGVPVPDDLRQAPQFAAAGFVAPNVLDDYMAACDALLVPLSDTLASRARWPSKANPFLARGRAVVMTGVGDLPALLAEHQAAVVTPPEPEALVNGLLQLLERPELRDQCEARGQQLARAHLAWPVLAARLEEIYEAVGARSRSAGEGGAPVGSRR